MAPTDWDINDSVVPKVSAHELDTFNDWPDGHCRCVYSAANEDCKKHTSGWAMRNTNNHNVNILKKSCLGVIVCSLSCQPAVGNKIRIRPAICDKARKKQRDKPCPNSECRGHLIIKPCRGHCGYPVTHFWRTSGSEVYFQAKGTHDHPRPEPKGSHQTKQLYAKRGRTAATASSHSSTGIDALKRKSAINSKLRALRGQVAAKVPPKLPQSCSFAGSTVPDAGRTAPTSASAFNGGQHSWSASASYSASGAQHYPQQLQYPGSSNSASSQIPLQSAASISSLSTESSSLSPQSQHQHQRVPNWLSYDNPPQTYADVSAASTPPAAAAQQCTAHMYTNSLSADAGGGDFLLRPEDIFQLDAPIVRTGSANGHQYGYAPSAYSNGMSPTSSQSSSCGSSSQSPPCTFLDLESGRIQSQQHATDFDLSGINQQQHQQHQQQQQQQHHLQQHQQQSHHQYTNNNNLVYSMYADASASAIKYETHGTGSTQLGGGVAVVGGGGHPNCGASGHSVHSDDTASISNEFDETYLSFQHQMAGASEYGLFFGAANGATDYVASQQSHQQHQQQQQQQQQQHSDQYSNSQAYASPDFDLITGAVDWSNAFSMQPEPMHIDESFNRPIHAMM